MFLQKTVRLPHGQRGFTATEVLVAGLITSVVIGATGTGIMTMLSANARSEARSERRIEMNRALDFISDEVKTAGQIWDSGATPPAWAGALTLGSANGETPGLYLQVPLPSASIASPNRISLNNHRFTDGDAVLFTGSADFTSLGITASTSTSAQVYYVVNSTASDFQIATTPSGPPVALGSLTGGTLIPNRLVVYYTRSNDALWLGPRTLNRATGNCAPNPDLQCPVLVDSVSTDPPSPAPPAFQAKISPTSSRRVSLGLTAKLYDNPSVGATDDTLNVTTDSLARPGLMALGGGGSSPTPTPSPSSTPTPPPGFTKSNNFEVKDGEVILNTPSTISLRILGGDLRCGASGSPMQTEVTAEVRTSATTANTQNIATPMANQPTAVLNFGPQVAGARMNVTGIIKPGALNNTCGVNAAYNSINPAHNGASGGTPQVLVLRNGDKLPDLAPFGPSPRIDEYLDKGGYINLATRTVTIAPNQVIYLFELGVTNPNSLAYDLQDVVALATIAAQ